MEQRKVWDASLGEFVEMPQEMRAFLDDIEFVCRKHGLSLAHEDIHGGFQVALLKEENLRWVGGAAKCYAHYDAGSSGETPLRKGGSKDRSAVRGKKLKDFLEERS